MRYRAVGALAVLLLSCVPVGHAAEVDEVLVEDAAGDVVLTTRDGRVPPQDGDQFRDVDLRAVGLLGEDDASLTFFVEVTSLQASSQNPLPFSDPNYLVYFRFGDQGYRVRIATVLANAANDVFGRDTGTYVRLEQQVGEDQYRGLAQGEGTLDFSANRATGTVPRAAIVDHNQAPLSLGAQIHGIWATASSMGWFDFPVGQLGPGGDPLLYVGAPMAFDQAPDSLGELPAYVMTTGQVKQKGGLVAVSDDPVRWTNGEASTLRFEATVTNTFTSDIPISIGLRNAKAEWTVAYSDRLTIPRGQSVNVTFLVTIPFSHNHGMLHMFEATFESLDKAHFAAADMGVYWPTVPQPAGHHDTIWVHSLRAQDDGGWFPDLGSGVHAWMSAIDEEELDERLPVPAMFTLPPNTFTDMKGIAFWRIHLEPALRMGLDFRPDETGTMELQLQFPTTVVDPQVSVRLSHIEQRQPQGRNGGFGQSTTLATASSEPISGTVSGQRLFELELAIDAAADKIPYGLNANMVLDIVMEATFLLGAGQADPAAATPHLIPGATWMKLPLNEYVEPVDLTFQTDGSVELKATQDGQQREVNPGRTVVYIFDLVYHGANATTFSASVTGTNTDWAQIVGDVRFVLEPHSQRRIALAVQAPAGTSAGERADLTLSVFSLQNAAVQAGINTVTTVVTGKDIPDESGRKVDLDTELSTKKDASGAGALASLVVLAGLAVALRRRR